MWRRGRAIEHHEAAAEVKRTTAGSAEAAEANYAPAEAAEALVTKKGFCSSTAWTAAATSEASSAARAVTAASARAVEEGEGKRAIAIEHHEAAAEVKRTTAGSAEAAEANYAPAEAAEACSRQRAERAAS